ncbi:MAG: DegV family protein [Christensenellales bacterium]|jgi:DegV family protein with EDD domain
MIVITTDSTAYLTRQEAKEMGVVHIPMTYSIGSEVYAETLLKNNHLFDELLRAAKAGEVHTSQPVIDSFVRRFKRLVDAGCHVLCLTISSRLSGTYSNAVECAKQFGDKVRVVDSRSAAGGMYLMLREAKKLIDKGLTLEEVAQAIENEIREKVGTRFSVADLTPLRRSGRLGLVRQSIGTILNQRPILTCKEGAVVCCDIARGRNDQLRKLVEAVPDNALDVTVQYFREAQEAEVLASRLSERFGVLVPVRRIGIVLGIHLGFDVIGTIWRTE